MQFLQYATLFLSVFLLTMCTSEDQSAATVKAETTSENVEENDDRKGGTSRPKKKDYDQLPLDKINLPEGFRIAVYAEDIEKARSLAFSETETLFIGTMSKKGEVKAVRDTNRDGKADQTFKLSDGWQLPNGVALKDGDLFVAEVSKIHRFTDIEKNLENPQPETIYDEFPTETHHGWKFIAFGPDGKLYVPVGAPCNLCLSENKVYASITRMNPNGSDMEIVHEGIRNTVGFTWHPETRDLWFTDNGRDWMGDDIPGCEVNRAPEDGMHFGYPFCHQGDIQEDDKKIPKRSCAEFTPPARVLGAHTAPLGIEFIPEGNFPQEYTGHILVAQHGSWNRTKKIGYDVLILKLEGDEVISSEPFASGWLESDDTVWGRPVDLEWMHDGSLLLSDDMANVVYRIWYNG